MNVWEEDWFPGTGVLHTSSERIAEFEPIGRADISDKQRARARLAAQAPAMARLLLSMLADRATDDWTFTGSEEETEIKDVLHAAGILS